MPRCHDALLLVILACTSASAADAALHRPGPGQAWGYLGDGSAVLAAKPPTAFSVEKNLAWKAELPCYGLATPIVVGESAFITCEPGAHGPWPLLVCISMHDGKEVWRAALNHLPATTLNRKQQQEAEHLFSEFWRKYLKAHELRSALRQDAGRKDEILAQVAALEGVDWNGNPKGYWKAKFADYIALNDKRSPYAAATLTQDTWSTMGNYGAWVVGEAFATPTSDGESIYVSTAQGGFFCFDLAGKLRWMKHHPGIPGEYCRNGRSPLIWKDLLLSDITARMRAIDRATGTLRWSAEVYDGSILTPTVIRCGETDIVLCGRGSAFRLPDGQALTVEGYSDFGTTALTKTDEPDVVFFTGGGEHGGWTEKGTAKAPHPTPTAVRFVLEGTTLKATVLWDGRVCSGRAAHTGMVYHGGKLFHARVGVIDAATGQLLAAAPKYGGGPLPATGHLLYLADGHLYGLKATGGGKSDKPAELVLNVSTLDGRAVASSSVPGHNYSAAFTLSGKSILIRSDSHLWCLR